MSSPKGGVRSCLTMAGALLASTLGLSCERSPRQPLQSSGAPVAVATALTSASSPVPSPPPVAPPAPLCGDPAKRPSALLFVSPEHPVRGQPFRIVAVSDQALDASLTVQGASNTPPTTVRDREGGPPYHWLAQVDAPAAGKWQAQLTRDAACGGGEVASLGFSVGKHLQRGPETPRTSLWLQRAEWSPDARGPVLGVDRADVRRTARRAAELERAPRSAARSLAQLPLRLPGRPPRTSRTSSSAPTARTSPTSSAPTSRSSWACPSGGRAARAATTPRRRRAPTSRRAATRSRSRTRTRARQTPTRRLRRSRRGRTRTASGQGHGRST